MSYESLMWILLSLKKDEMAPNERAIQSRAKEAFGYKITNLLWDKFIDGFQKQTAPQPLESQQIHPLNTNISSSSSGEVKSHGYSLSNP